MEPQSEGKRVFRCPQCRDAEKDAATGTLDYLKVYGLACDNCGFYARLGADEAEGHFHMFGFRKQGTSMSLTRRKRGAPTEGTLPLIVGGTFYCRDFRPVDAAPASDDHRSVPWAVKQLA